MSKLFFNMFSFGGEKALASQPERKQVDYDALYKLLLIGAHHSGKSSLLKRFANDTFNNDAYLSTIGVEFQVKTVQIGARTVKLQLWDTAGQERFRSITSSYYRGSQGVLLCFDSSSEESFAEVPKWLGEVRKMCAQGVDVVLVATKCDRGLPKLRERAAAFAAEHSLLYRETSARTREGVEEAFVDLARAVARVGASEEVSTTATPRSVRLEAGHVEAFDAEDLARPLGHQKAACPGGALKVQKADANVFRVELAHVVTASPPLITGDLVLCCSCGSAMNMHSVVLQEPPEGEEEGKEEEEEEEIRFSLELAPPIHESFEMCYAERENADASQFWPCEFCGEVNSVDVSPEELPQAPLVEYLVSAAPSQQQTDRQHAAPTVFLVVDASGSMCVTREVPGVVSFRGAEQRAEEARELMRFGEGQQYYGAQRRNVTYVSRLQSVQSAAQAHIERVVAEEPSTRVVLIVFADDVRVISSQGADVVVAGDTLDSWERLEHVARGISLADGAHNDAEHLISKLWEVREGGQTALGPALKVAVELASSVPGSHVTVFTDGLANVGVGALDVQQPAKFMPFYVELGERCKLHGTTLDVVTLGDANCRLENLAVLSSMSGGKVDRVDHSVQVVTNNNTLAIKGFSIITLPRVLHFRGEQDDELERRNFVCKDVGTIHERDAPLSLAYGFRPIEQVGRVDVEQPLYFQAQLMYTRMDGSVVLRVATGSLRATLDREEAERLANPKVLATHFVAKAANRAKAGEAGQARLEMRALQRMLKRGQHDGSWAERVQDLDDVLEEQQQQLFFSDAAAQVTSTMEQVNEDDLFG